VKAELAQENVTQSASQIENLVNQAIERIDEVEWKNAVSHVKKMKVDYWARD
jgi:hypothetical protein